MRRLLAAVALGTLLTTPARATGMQGRLGPPGVPRVVPGAPFSSLDGIITACWLDYRYFRTLSAGVVDYCRTHLRFEPGALDCYQYTDRVCSVFLPNTVEWIETRQTVAPVLFPCPDGPEPPVCPRLR